jgi:hypothetical protein
MRPWAARKYDGNINDVPVIYTVTELLNFIH